MSQSDSHLERVWQETIDEEQTATPAPLPNVPQVEPADVEDVDEPTVGTEDDVGDVNEQGSPTATHFPAEIRAPASGAPLTIASTSVPRSLVTPQDFLQRTAAQGSQLQALPPIQYAPLPGPPVSHQDVLRRIAALSGAHQVPPAARLPSLLVNSTPGRPFATAPLLGATAHDALTSAPTTAATGPTQRTRLQSAGDLAENRLRSLASGTTEGVAVQPFAVNFSAPGSWGLHRPLHLAPGTTSQISTFGGLDVNTWKSRASNLGPGMVAALPVDGPVLLHALRTTTPVLNNLRDRIDARWLFQNAKEENGDTGLPALVNSFNSAIQGQPFATPTTVAAVSTLLGTQGYADLFQQHFPREAGQHPDRLHPQANTPIQPSMLYALTLLLARRNSANVRFGMIIQEAPGQPVLTLSLFSGDTAQAGQATVWVAGLGQRDPGGSMRRVYSPLTAPQSVSRSQSLLSGADPMDDDEPGDFSMPEDREDEVGDDAQMSDEDTPADDAPQRTQSDPEPAATGVPAKGKRARSHTKTPGLPQVKGSRVTKPAVPKKAPKKPAKKRNATYDSDFPGLIPEGGQLLWHRGLYSGNPTPFTRGGLVERLRDITGQVVHSNTLLKRENTAVENHFGSWSLYEQWSKIRRTGGRGSDQGSLGEPPAGFTPLPFPPPRYAGMRGGRRGGSTAEAEAEEEDEAEAEEEEEEGPEEEE